jgi:hypothetical protein
MIVKNGSPVFSHMHFSITHLSVSENAFSVKDIKYLSLQNRLYCKFCLSKIDYIIGVNLMLFHSSMGVVQFTMHFYCIASGFQKGGVNT